jgi:hypothetical protein
VTHPNKIKQKEREWRRGEKKDFSSIFCHERSGVYKHREMQMAGERMRVPLALFFFFFSYVCLFGHVCFYNRARKKKKKKRTFFSF